MNIIDRSRIIRDKQRRELAEDRNTDINPAIDDLKRPYNNRNRFDRTICGAIELAFMRGEHSGYLKGYADCKAKRKSKW